MVGGCVCARSLDDDASSGKPLKLTSKDKKEFTVERKHAFVSTLVKTSLENGMYLLLHPLVPVGFSTTPLIRCCFFSVWCCYHGR